MKFEQFLAYSASAGSGKTFALSVRYISLLFMGESPEHILAATFTNKAAGEMRFRVIDSLNKLHLKENRAFLENISEQTGLSCDELIQKQPKVLDKFLKSSSSIVTLDSFFQSILRATSLEIGVEPDFTVGIKNVEDEIKNLFLETLYRENRLHLLVKFIIEANDKTLNNLWDRLGGLYELDAFLKEFNYKYRDIKESEEKIKSLMLKLRDEVELLGASKKAIENFEPLDKIEDISEKSFFKYEKLEDNRVYKKYIENSPNIEDDFKTLKSYIKEWIDTKEENYFSFLFKLYSDYKNSIIRATKDINNLRFMDITYFTYILLHEHIEKDFLYFRIDTRFRHILLDEFQDTSLLQFLLMKPLIDEFFSGVGQYEFQTFFYVGDTKQSLYRFRGGREELFNDVANIFNIPIKNMDTNYRSKENIINFVNRVFEPVLEKYVPQKSRDENIGGYVEVRESEELIEETIKTIEDLMEKGVNQNSIVVLVRKNDEGTQLQEECNKKGIDTLLKTSSSLKTLPKIASLVSMVKYLFYGEKIDAYGMLIRTDRKFETIEDTSWFRPTMSPLDVLNRLINEFGYFNDDANILILLEFASKYREIPVFLMTFEYSKIDVASHTLDGVNIMTIHSSKGLEFDYVIIMDRISNRDRPDTDFIHQYNGSNIDKTFKRVKNRNLFDKEYSLIMEKEKEAVIKDRKNLLYVAFTRAKDGLLIIKKEKNTLFDILNIHPTKIGEIKVEEKEEEIIYPRTKKREKPLEYYGRQEVERDEKSTGAYEEKLFGTALHFTLEMLYKDNLKDALSLTKQRFGKFLTNRQINDIQERIENLLKNSEFKELLQNADITKEQSLSFEGKIKQIDMLLEYKTHSTVVEYKSSYKYTNIHQEQVFQYMKASKKITNKPTNGVIIYLLEGEIRVETLKIA